MKSVLWFLNYSELNFVNHTTECKVFNTLKECKEYSKGKYGYIIRSFREADYKPCNNSFHSFINGFEPSASEQNNICSLIEA
jgi:hypothetical protein